MEPVDLYLSTLRNVAFLLAGFGCRLTPVGRAALLQQVRRLLRPPTFEKDVPYSASHWLQ